MFAINQHPPPKPYRPPNPPLSRRRWRRRFSSALLSSRHPGRVWKGGCGQPGPAFRPWQARGRLKRATPPCLVAWPSPVWPRRASVWAPPGSRAGSPTAINRSYGLVFGARPGRPTVSSHRRAHTHNQNNFFHIHIFIYEFIITITISQVYMNIIMSHI